MAKKIKTLIKLAVEAGKATPAPPVGPALGQHGVNIMAFVKEYNAKTADQVGKIIPAVITVYQDNSFSFETITPPTSSLLKTAAGIEKGSGNSILEKVGSVSRDKVMEIAKEKLKDLNAADIDGAVKIVEGTARSMGIEVSE